MHDAMHGATMRHVIAWPAFVLAITASTPGYARVQPYQIVRLLTYKTSCVVEKIEDQSTGKGGLHFLAACENVTFYPQGVVITCADPDDDRSCKVETAPRSLDNLQLLQQAH